MIGPGNSEEEFEKRWKEAFAGDSKTPPASVWNELDRQLLKEELVAYKTRNSYYKWGIAASILMAGFLGISQYVYFSNQGQNRVLTGIVHINEPTENSFALKIPTKPKPTDGSFLSKKLQTAFAYQDNPVTDEIDRDEFEGLELGKLGPNLVIAANTDKQLYRVATYPYLAKVKKSDVSGNDKYWAGLNVGSGNFDPNYQSGNTSLASLDSNPAFSLINNEAVDTQGPNLREGMTAGETIALGLNFGFKLSSRWSLESGVQYARSDATTTTNVVIESSRVQEVIPASAEIRSIPQVESLIGSEDILEYNYKDVDMANQFQFAMIPVKAGYLLIDNKFRVQVNAGFAANLYLGNTLSDPENEMANVTIGPGDSSPYRELSFSGLAGVQFGYEFLKNFDFVLEPNYRQSINSLTKENSSFSANPSGFGIMTGIRYNFN